MKNNGKSKKRYLFISILILFLAYTCANIWLSSNWLTVNTYEYTPDAQLTANLRLLVLSDLHEHEFGDNNEKLIEKVSEQEPDLILLAGDFVNADSNSSDSVCTLIQGLKNLAPVYFSLGNHEMDYMEKNGDDLLNEIEATGAVVLEKEFVDVEVKGNTIRLGGMYEYAFGLDGEDSAESAPEDIKAFLEEFQDTENLKIMMAHRPDSFIFGNASSYWEVDLVVSGHNHGGQVKVPFLGGLYGGDQGWFPEYVHGLYVKDGMNIFVTSGLGDHGELLPRFSNLPELALIEIGNE